MLTPRSRSVRGGPGFSLIEVLISMTVLIIGFLGIIGTYPSMLDLNLTSWGNVQAVNLAEQKLEDIVSTGAFISTSTTADNPSALPSCTRSWIGSPDPFGNPNLQFVTVLVQWKEKGRTRYVNVNTYLSR